LKILLATTVAFSAIAATQAMAADIVRPVVVAPFTWTGHYAGLHCGVAWGRTHSSDDEDGVSIDPRGGLCGGQIGSNWQTGAWVFGLEGELGGLSMRDTAYFHDAPDLFVARVEYGGYATLAARLGWAFAHSGYNNLFYLKGGGAVAHIENTWAEFESGDLEAFAAVSETRWGWALGVGFESAVNNRWSWKLEYLAMDFGDNDTTVGSIGDPEEATKALHHDNLVHTFKLGVNWRW
jgi:outer membrane immunogenic protein